MEKMNTTRKRSLKKDEKAVSPVIGVIMMIAIVVIIAAVVAAFAYGIIGGVKKAPSSALVVEGVKVSNNPVNVSVFHHGGDSITQAFVTTNGNITSKWDNLQVRLNGATVGGSDTGEEDLAKSIWLNDAANETIPWEDGTFAPGDQLVIKFNKLTDGDTIVILHVPSENILQRITVSG